MKKLFLWLIFLAVAFFFFMQVSNAFQAKVLYFSDWIKVGILNINNNALNAITRHFHQAQHIKELSEQLKDKEALQYSYNALESEYNSLLKVIESDLSPREKSFSLSRVISLAEINNYTRVWLEQKNLQSNREEAIFGLISNNQVAGIAVFRNQRLIGYLNGDEKCSYSVIIGQEKAPGVIKHDINKGFVVDYIPLYSKIEIGEMVYTSGLDTIFYPGVLVGEIESIEEKQGYQVAVVKPSVSEIARFYWIVDIETPMPPPPIDEESESTNP